MQFMRFQDLFSMPDTFENELQIGKLENEIGINDDYDTIFDMNYDDLNDDKYDDDYIMLL